MKKLLSLLLIICAAMYCLPGSTIAQDSTHLRISLLTCTPGNELYSTFGHSALRVTDSVSNKDLVFNYGTFDFDDPDFYSKFVKGKLLYFVSVEYLTYFNQEYQLANRGITEQVLLLSGEEKLSLKNFLINNIKEENKYYQYDFLFDNCTTRLRDIITRSKKTKPSYTFVMPPGTRFRQAIHQYLQKNDKEWDKLGIDILLGAPTDAVMTIEQQQFLPDNLMKALDSTHNMVLSSTQLYPFETNAVNKSWCNPMIVFSLLLLLIVLLDISKNKAAWGFLKVFDFLLFFSAGAIGILLVFMWWGTNHAMCKNNFNLLWAIPSHCMLAFFIGSKKKWVKKYFFFTAIAMLLLLVAWYFLPQQLNISLLAIVLLVLYRSLRRCQLNNAV